MSKEDTLLHTGIMGKRLAASTAIASTSNIHFNSPELYNKIDNLTETPAIASISSTGGIEQQVSNPRISALRKRKHNGINNTNNLNKKICLQNSSNDNVRNDVQSQNYAQQDIDDINDKGKLPKQKNLKYYETKSNNNNQHYQYQNNKKKEQHQQNGNIINYIKKNATTTPAKANTYITATSNQQQQHKIHSINHHNSKTELKDSPRHVYSLRPSIVNGTLLRDLRQNVWRLGQPIGK